MDNQLEDFKALKEMLESGAISKDEFDKMKSDLLKKSMANDGVRSAMEPSGRAKFFKKMRWVFIFVALAIIGAVGAWIYFRPNPKDLAKKYTESFCECEEQRNNEYINALTEFLSSFEGKGYSVSGEVEASLKELEDVYNKHDQTVGVSSCFDNLNAQKSKLEANYKKGTSAGSEFWSDVDIMIAGNIKLTEQYQKIKQLIASASQKKAMLKYSSEEELLERKQFLHDQIWSMYSAMSSGYFDAYSFFGYNVERYYSKENITPTDINVIYKTNSDHTDFSHKLISETLAMEGQDNGREIWKYSTEYKAWRPSMEKWQISNVWYRVVFNDQNKIESYTEASVENTKYFTAQEYNSMFGNSDYEENW